MPRRTYLIQLVALLALFLAAKPGIPYSIQTHEELIDLAWKASIRPILLKHYPTLTEPQLLEAHAYAYGGCAIQDFGYYPFGNKFFSDLTHYVRSGDFVLALLHNAKTPDELAFAIGSLSHYIGDTIGHSAAVNISVPVEFPSLKKKYGPSVNYAQSPHAHVQTEFAFDIDQLSKGRFAPSGYFRHIGIQIPTSLLANAFFETYGLHLPHIIGTRQAALRTYRFAARSFLPSISTAETLLHTFPPNTPSPDLDVLSKDLKQASDDNDWETYRKTPGFGSHLFAGFIYLLPKFGVLKLLAIKGPQPQTEPLYVKSVLRSIASLRLVLSHFDTIENYLPDRDLDTGLRVRPGGYSRTDKTYAKLLHELAKHPELPIPRQIQYDLQAYYSNPKAPIITKKDPKRWAEVQADLKVLQTMKTMGNLESVHYEDNGFDPDPEPDPPYSPS